MPRSLNQPQSYRSTFSSTCIKFFSILAFPYKVVNTVDRFVVIVSARTMVLRWLYYVSAGSYPYLLDRFVLLSHYGSAVVILSESWLLYATDFPAVAWFLLLVPLSTGGVADSINTHQGHTSVGSGRAV
ncbi:hypothetical protein Tco_0551161 [Tanacetum coccineum]